MTLKRILNKIDELPDIPFSRFYTQFVMDVQDRGIELEIKHMGKNVTISQMDNLLSEVYKELIGK